MKSNVQGSLKEKDYLRNLKVVSSLNSMNNMNLKIIFNIVYIIISKVGSKTHTKIKCCDMCFCCFSLLVITFCILSYISKFAYLL